MARGPMSHATFIRKARQLYGERYSLEKARYQGGTHPILLICPEHGEFTKIASEFLRGNKGCQRCAAHQTGQKNALRYTGQISPKRKDTAYFITRATARHGTTYDYTEAVYTRAHTPLTVICPQHGRFTVSPSNHYAGKGCPDCKPLKLAQGRTRSLASLTAQYQTLDGSYTVLGKTMHNNTSRLLLSCATHGPFPIVLSDCKRRRVGCPKCRCRAEYALNDTLRAWGHATIQQSRTLIPPYEIDIYLPKHGLAIEYCGHVWHSTVVKPFADARIMHERKRRLCETAGLQLITIFEGEWLTQRPIILAILQHKLHGAPLTCYARQTTLHVLTTATVAPFYTQHHLQGSPGRGIHLGLHHHGTLVAAMSFGTGNAHRGSPTWELTRFACAGRIPGAASKLFHAFLQHTPDVATITSYVDHRYFTGTLYERLGFTYSHYCGVSYRTFHTSTPLLLHHKAWTTRRRLADRYGAAFNPALSERENCLQIGIHRIYNAGTSCYRWQAATGRTAAYRAPG